MKTGAQTRQEKVSAEITLPAKGRLALVSSASLGESTFEIKILSSKKLRVEAAGTSELERGDDECFATPLTPGQTQPDRRLCTEDGQLSFELEGVPSAGTRSIWVLNRVRPDEAPPTLEPPTELSLDALRELARDRAFDSRIEFEQTTQARLNAQNAYAALLPRITVGDVLGLLSFNWMSLLRSAGDFFPFLFPNRWLHARAASSQYRSERLGWLLLRANSAQITEALALSALRDAESVASVRAALPALEDLRERMRDREQLGIAPPGASDDLTVIVDSLNRTLANLDQLLQQERAALALAVGLTNPEGVSHVLPSALADAVSNPEAFDPEWVRVTALDRSLEIQQMDALIAQAKDEKRAKYYDWIDPSGGSLSFTMPGTIGIGQSVVRELGIKRQQLQALVLQKAEIARIDLDSLLGQYRLAANLVATHDRRLARIQDEIDLGLPPSFTELQLATLDRMKAELDRIGSKYAYAAAVGKLNRLLLAGPYVDLYPGKP